jgi:Pyruvate/2-oxoacid:ferredoxin oxidoreductase gamma subunit
MTTLTKTETYPPLEELMAELTKTGGHVLRVAALAESTSMGIPKSANVLMLGAFCAHFSLIPPSMMEGSVGRVLGTKGTSAILAFKRGFEMAQEGLPSPHR